MSAGKGDRPRAVNKSKFDENYDAIFRKKGENKSKISQLKREFKKLKIQASIEGMRILDKIQELEGNSNTVDELFHWEEKVESKEMIDDEDERCDDCNIELNFLTGKEEDSDGKFCESCYALRLDQMINQNAE